MTASTKDCDGLDGIAAPPKVERGRADFFSFFLQVIPPTGGLDLIFSQMRPKAISLRRQPVPQMKRRFQTPIVQHDLRSISADICTVLILVVFSQTSRFGFNVRPRIFLTQNGAFGHAWRP